MRHKFILVPIILICSVLLKLFPYFLVGEGSTTPRTPDFCTGPFIKKVKLPSSCTFENGACGYTAPKTGLVWAIRTGKYGFGSLGITAAHGGSGECKTMDTGLELYYALMWLCDLIK